MTIQPLWPRQRTGGRRWLALLLAGVVVCLSIRGLAYGGMDGTTRSGPPAPTELTAEEQTTISVFEKATRSVVFIANTAKQRNPWSFNLFEVPQGSGSGFIWNKQGHVVTNFHVVYGADAIIVTLADRTEYKAKVVRGRSRS